MLDIQVQGQSVDLPENIQLSLTIENPFLTKDRIPIPYSLSVELPLTAHNLKLFCYPNRLGTKNRNKKYPCEIFFKSVRISSGSLHIDGVRSTIRVSFVGAGINDLSHPLYTNDLGRKVFEGDYHEVNYDLPSNFAFQYYLWGKERTTRQDDYMFAPISIKNQNMPSSIFRPMDGSRIPDFSGFPRAFQQKFREMFENAFELKRPYESCNTELINSYSPVNASFLRVGSTSEIQTYHSPLFPIFRVGWLIDKIFGNELKNNLFNTDSLLQDVLLPTFYFPTWKESELADMSTNSSGKLQTPPMVSNPRPEADQPYPDQPYVELKDFLPDYPTNKFIQECIKLFGITITAYRGKLYMRWNNDILSSPVKYDWSDKLLDTYDIEFQERKPAKFKYKSSKNVETKDDVVRVQTVRQMIEYPYSLNDQGSYSEVFYIEQTKQFFTKTITSKDIKLVGQGLDNWTERQINYEETKDGLQSDIDTDNQDDTIESELTPLHSTFASDFIDLQNPLTAEGRFAYIVPTVELPDRLSRPKELHITLYKSPAPIISGIISGDYPRLSSYPTGAVDQKTLQWKHDLRTLGEYGLVGRYHSNYLDWSKKDKVKLSATLLLDVLDLHNLDITDKVHIEGRNFFIEKIEYTITRDHIQPAEIDFIEC